MKERVQKFGRFLSGMVMPNIGAFIAWGLIAALFIKDGWLPNETIADMVTPMLSYLLPILIGYTGGKVVGGQKGAVTGALATLGAIASTESTMFIGAMICGPLGGWCIKKFDEKMEGHIPAGFEMVVNNFSVGIIGALLAILSIFLIGPVCVGLTTLLGAGVNALVNLGLLPLTAILVEPAKVLFLNNAINHGIFTPIGTEQALEVGKSILFMIESNPGPGLGLLLAYCVAGKGETRSSAGAAAVIQFVGGIHEIYFPYVLMNPIVILGPMAGNVVGIFLLNLLGGGLKGPASPGSIIAEMMLTPKDSYVANIAGIAGIEVIHHPVSEIPGDCQIVVTHHELSGRAAQRAPQARIVPIKNFMGAPEYDMLVEELSSRGKAQAALAPVQAEEKKDGRPILVERKNILINCGSEPPEDIIRRCGRMMVDSGYTTEEYIEGMVQRDREFSVAIGCHVAIPHGIESVRGCVKKTGLVVLTYPQGIQWGDEVVKLVIGIAALGDEHMDVLTVISEIAGSEEDTDALVNGADVETLYKKLNGLA